MKITLETPPGIIITTNNWFHEGWLFGILGLPERKFIDPDRLVRDIDIDSWRCGYEMAKETPSLLKGTFIKMIELGQINVKVRDGYES